MKAICYILTNNTFGFLSLPKIVNFWIKKKLPNREI